MSGSFSRLSPSARAKAHEPHVLIVTKANSRSTVHRPIYLDYVGVKSFDADGNVTGERRFLGLFTSTAYTESVRDVPVIGRKVDDVLARSGFSPASHSGKDLLTILETYPRDELFQIGLDDLYDTATAVMYLEERRRTRLFLRRDDYGRFMSCLVYIPRDRYTTAVRLRMEEILKRAFDGASVDYTTRVSESLLARLHFVVRVPAGHAAAGRRRRGAGAPAGRRHPHLGRGPGRGAAGRPRRGGAPPGSSGSTAGPSPRRTRRTSRRASRSPTCGTSRPSTARMRCGSTSTRSRAPRPTSAGSSSTRPRRCR